MDADLQITQIINHAKNDDESWDEVLPIVYHQLKKVARAVKSNHRTGKTLNTTSLVHDVFIKIRKHGNLSVENTKHFYRVAAQAMRQILVDSARAKLSAKRDADVISWEEEIQSPKIDQKAATATQVIDIDNALHELKKLNARLSQIVEIHFFGGYSFVEVANILDISESTVIRDWNKARAWLYAKLI